MRYGWRDQQDEQGNPKFADENVAKKAWQGLTPEQKNKYVNEAVEAEGSESQPRLFKKSGPNFRSAPEEWKKTFSGGDAEAKKAWKELSIKGRRALVEADTTRSAHKLSVANVRLQDWRAPKVLSRRQVTARKEKARLQTALRISDVQSVSQIEELVEGQRVGRGRPKKGDKRKAKKGLADWRLKME